MDSSRRSLPLPLNSKQMARELCKERVELDCRVLKWLAEEPERACGEVHGGPMVCRQWIVFDSFAFSS